VAITFIFINNTTDMSIENSDEGLKRVIGVTALTLSIISGVIGAGIFVLPAVVGIELGAFSVIAYIVCGILLAAIMVCYAEIGSRVITSGGSYAYVEKAFGTFPGYIINWLYFLGWGAISSAALMNIVADSLNVLFPVFANTIVRAVFFLILVVFMIMVNIYGAKQGAGVVKVIAIIKLLPILGIIVFGFSKANSANLHWEHLPSLKSFADTTLILFFAFAGFETALGASGEIKNPQRTVPLSICIAAISVIIVYMLLQTVTQGVLGAQMAIVKDAPLAAVADRIIGPAGATILLLCAALSCFGNVVLDLLCTPRSLFAGARDGIFPKYLGKVHSRFATPYLAIITYGVLIFIFSISGGFRQLAIMASAIILIVYLAVILATIKLRLKNAGGGEKLFKAPGGWATPLIGIGGILWLLSSLGKWEIISTVIFIIVVGIVYFVTKWLRNKGGAVEIVK
jgi:basic amino acid/polyamine antiporter, APA family